MTRKIYKYPLAIEPHQEVTMPRGAKVLCFMNQYETPVLWAEVDPDERAETRLFHLVGTGHEVTPQQELVYIGTASFRGGGLMWHLYECV